MTLKEQLNGVMERVELAIEYLEIDPKDICNYDKAEYQLNNVIRELIRIKNNIG